MYLSKNSSREQILKYLEKDPYNFLLNFSDKPWAQPYIDEAAKEVANNYPFIFLGHYLSESWAKTYLELAAKSAAKKYPEHFLKHWAGKLPQGIDTALFELGSENVSR